MIGDPWAGILRFVLVTGGAALAGYLAVRFLFVLLRARGLLREALDPRAEEPAPEAGDAEVPEPDAQPLTGPVTFDQAVLRHCARPLAWLVPVLAVRLALPAALPPGLARARLDHLLALLAVGAVAWLLVRLVRAAEEVARSRFPVHVRDNLRARRVHTQIEIVRKVLVVIIFVVTAAAVLMTFERFRQIGTGLLASAGLAGLIIGLAAQKTLGNLLAGIQIALTQPIRLDDVVIVEGEWGWIEEITLTYVVVRIWDQRRLVLPIAWFIENPFQNWTRTTAEILGTVFIYADYTVPVGEVRAELERLLEESEYWDGRVRRLHVTEAGRQCVELRCLMSAKDSGTAWELRCEIREKLLDWFRRTHPGALPRVRAELDRLPEGERAGALGPSAAGRGGPDRTADSG
jgi:small-conductance mechanosensitive channel